MGGMDGLVALLAGGAHGVDAWSEQRKADALQQRNQQRLDDADEERKRTGRRLAQSDVIGLQSKGYDELPMAGLDDAGSAPSSASQAGDVSLNDYDGHAHRYRYNAEHDPAAVRAAASIKDRDDVLNADRARKSAAQAAAYRIATHKAQPGDEAEADPDALARYTELMHRDRMSEAMLTVRQALLTLGRDRFDHTVEKDNRAADPNAAAAAGKGIMKRSVVDSRALAMSMDPDTWGGDPEQPGPAHDKREEYFREYTRLVPEVGPEHARTQALKNIGDMTGDMRPKVKDTSVDSLMAAALGTKKPTGPASAAPTRPAAARTPAQAVPMAPPASRPATGPVARPVASPATQPVAGPASGGATAGGGFDAALATLQAQRDAALQRNVDPAAVQARYNALVIQLRQRYPR